MTVSAPSRHCEAPERRVPLMECAPWNVCVGIVPGWVHKGPCCTCSCRIIWASHNVPLTRVHLVKILTSNVSSPYLVPPFPTGRWALSHQDIIIFGHHQTIRKQNEAMTGHINVDSPRTSVCSLHSSNCLYDPGNGTGKAECGPHLSTRGECVC